MLERLIDPILNFISSFGQQEEDDKLDVLLRPYAGKELWLAVAPNRSKVLFTAISPKILQAKADALGIQDFISLRAPRKIEGGSQ